MTIEELGFHRPSLRGGNEKWEDLKALQPELKQELKDYSEEVGRESARDCEQSEPADKKIEMWEEKMSYEIGFAYDTEKGGLFEFMNKVFPKLQKIVKAEIAKAHQDERKKVDADKMIDDEVVKVLYGKQIDLARSDEEAKWRKILNSGKQMYELGKKEGSEKMLEIIRSCEFNWTREEEKKFWEDFNKLK